MDLWEHIEQELSAALDRKLELKVPDSLGGGCINQAYRVRSGDENFFVKLNSADRLDMFVAEAEGLRELARGRSLRVPQPHCWGAENGHAYLVMEYLPLAGRGNPAALGEGMATIHRITAEQYGWHRDNTIGSTPQRNTQESDWLTFWRDHRLAYQLDLARTNGASSAALNAGERLLEALPKLLGDHNPPASLLHGDLWSGNYSFTNSGDPSIFDPAVYYGDRETDIAMTELFGGFGNEFYAAYRGAWPLDSEYATRKSLYNLYHVLNHFNLFGGGYLSQAQRLMDSLVSETR